MIGDYFSKETKERIRNRKGRGRGENLCQTIFEFSKLLYSLTLLSSLRRFLYCAKYSKRLFLRLPLKGI